MSASVFSQQASILLNDFDVPEQAMQKRGKCNVVYGGVETRPLFLPSDDLGVNT
jgi:hypothetical protein